MQTELKKLAELNPELKDAYLAKQRRLKVTKVIRMLNKLQCLLSVAQNYVKIGLFQICDTVFQHFAAIQVAMNVSSSQIS